MLLRLTIRDFILVDRLELEFAAGFGALTGETGAGKSILIDALSFVLGERADAGLVRPGAERAEVSAEFDVGALAAIRARLAGQDIDAGDELLLRRVVDAGGRSRAYVNGSPITLQQLRELSDGLVDIHGQHAHQSLLRGDAQRDMLDDFGGHGALVGEVGDLWRRWREVEARLEAARHGGEAIAREREQLEWEVKELEGLGFTADEWAAINTEQGRLAHASSLAEGAEFAVDTLADGEVSGAAMLSSVALRLEGLAAFDDRLAAIAALVRSAETEVREAAAELRRYRDRVELDPGRLAEVDRRIEAVLACARKFRVAPESLPEQLAGRRQRLAELGDSLDPQAIEAAAQQAGALFLAAGRRLSEARQATAERLGALVSEAMQTLALAGGRFAVALLPIAEGSTAGCERVEFQVGGLAGGELRALAKVASGGELSRIGLALQVVASQVARVPTLIFDEVDVGIGGGVAEVVGRMLNALGRQRQVLCVTHLPQVAARADWQWRVSKRRDGEVLRSEVEVLDAAGRIEEIARMLGGMEITAVTRQHAREMLAIA